MSISTLWSQSPLIAVPFMTGSIFIVAGLITLKFPPKKINWIYGYRTPRSMKNQERWDFAQIYSSRVMIKLGGFLVLFSLLGLAYQPKETISSMIALAAILTSTVLLIVRVEKAIKNHFDKLT